MEGLQQEVQKQAAGEEAAAVAQEQISGEGIKEELGQPSTSVIPWLSDGPVCQVIGCKTDLASSYDKKSKTCTIHRKVDSVDFEGVPHRFCQKCSRFHSLDEFDGGKRNCRSRLIEHNVRQRRLRMLKRKQKDNSFLDIEENQYLRPYQQQRQAPPPPPPPPPPPSQPAAPPPAIPQPQQPNVLLQQLLERAFPALLEARIMEALQGIVAGATGRAGQHIPAPAATYPPVPHLLHATPAHNPLAAALAAMQPLPATWNPTGSFDVSNQSNQSYHPVPSPVEPPPRPDPELQGLTEDELEQQMVAIAASVLAKQMRNS